MVEPATTSTAATSGVGRRSHPGESPGRIDPDNPAATVGELDELDELDDGEPQAARALAGLRDLGRVSDHLESAPPQRIVAWAIGWFGSGVSLAASFQDCVLIDMATRIDPSIEVVFLDTGFHFPETLRYVEEVRGRYELNLRVVHPGPDARGHPCGTERCCETRKVLPLQRVLRGKQAWMSGLRRVETAQRSGSPIVDFDWKRNVVKVNPLATWTDDDVADYIADNGLPVHPLSARGYASIGCAPTTRPVKHGENPRAGRWSGEEKTECGLHI